MPRIPHSILLKAYKKASFLPLVLRGSRTLPSAINELRWIIEHVQENARKEPKIQQQKLLRLCKRRSKGEPLQYILGSQPFGELDIKCRPGVLIPRPETEAYTTQLANLITSHRLARVLTHKISHGDDPLENPKNLQTPDLRILDLCTGSGCIPLLLNSLLWKSCRYLQIHGWDISDDAVALAKENLAHNVHLGHVKESLHNRLRFEVVDIFDDESKLLDIFMAHSSVRMKTNSAKVDIIVSNPPYISQEAFRTETTRSVRNWEPKLALVPEKAPPSKLLQGIETSDMFYQRLMVLHSTVFRSRVLLMEVGDEAQGIRVAKMALAHYGPTNNKPAKTWNCVEIWRDSPDMDELEKLKLGGDEIFVRGSGDYRAVVLFQVQPHQRKGREEWETSRRKRDKSVEEHEDGL